MKTGSQVMGYMSEASAALSVMLFPYAPKMTVLFLVLHFLFSWSVTRRNPIGISAIHPVLWISAGFFILHGISLLYSENATHGLRDLETKMALLLLPLAAVLLPRSGSEKESFMRFIMISALISLLVSFSYSSYMFFRSGEISSFFYDSFSFFMHPTYYTMFLNMVLVIHLAGLVTFDAQRQLIYKKTGAVITLLILAGVILTSSRAGIVISLITATGLLLGNWFRTRNRYWLKQCVFLVLTAIALFVSAMAVNPGSRYSILVREVFGIRQPDGLVDESKVDVNPASHRKLLWGVALDLCLKNPLGVGNGDVQDVLVVAYARTGFDKAVIVRYNPHNQYLQSWLALGIPGLLLCLLMMFPVLGKRGSNRVLLFLLLIFGLNAVFESVLEVQRGVMMYALSVLYFTIPDEQSQSPEQQF